jgi:hypothetical protein
MSDVSPAYSWYRALEGRWWRPEHDPTRIPPERPPHKTVWLWTLAVVVVVVAVLILNLVAKRIDRLSATPIHVVYSVRGPATASVTYDTFTNADKGTDRKPKVSTPWTTTVNGHRPYGFFSVHLEAESLASESTALTCEISVDGRQVAEHTSVGRFATVDCWTFP